MARLPRPGGDDGSWGDILNNFLKAALNTDGSLKTVSIEDGGTGATSVDEALDNLGIDASAILPVGTGADTIAAGDDPRFEDERAPIDGSVTSDKLDDEAVTASKIVDGSISLDKLDTDTIVGDYLSTVSGALDVKLGEQSQEYNRIGSTFGQARIPTETVHDMILGHSLGRGSGIGVTIGHTDWGSALSRMENLAAGLRDSNPGWVPCYENHSFWGGIFAWDNRADGAIGQDHGLGTPTNTAGWTLSNNNDEIGDTRVFDVAEIVYTKMPAGGATFQVSIDGGSTWSANIPTTDAGLSAQKSGFRWQSAETTLEEHEMIVRQTSAGTLKIDGYIAHKGTATAGHIMINASHGGAGASNFLDDNRRWEHYLESFTPRRLYIVLAMKDSVFDGTAQDWAAKMDILIPRARTASPLTTIVLIAEYYSSAPALGNPNVSEAEWRDVWIPTIEAVALEHDCVFVNLYERFGDCSEDGDPYVITTDNGSHFGPEGMQAIAELMGERLGLSYAATPGLLASGSISMTGDLDMDDNQINNIGLPLTLTTPAVGSALDITASDSKFAFEYGADAPTNSHRIAFYANDTDAQAGLAAGIIKQFGWTGIAAGPGGASAGDSFFVRSAAATWNLVNAKITGSGTPTADSDLATKVYKDARTLNTQTGTSYTLVLTDQGKIVEMNNGSAMTLTIPTNASVAFPTGTMIQVTRYGAGSLAISPVNGTVTIRSRSGLTSVNGQYGVVRLYKRATNEWELTGDLA